ncbi:MAG: SMC-Scp complex subunit ScpB [Geobacteraceae bacterium]|nr:SMC-Scp complex subunit ScpB [Geobacteraceae bacterium]
MTGTALKSIVESLFFISDAPLTLERLCAILEEYQKSEVEAAIARLRDDYAETGRGIRLAEVAGGYQLRSSPENADYIRRLVREKSFKFSRSALETLAVIAYRQPITRAEVEYLRGVDTGGVLKTLLEKKMIRILGKKDIPGKPLIYGTSREFLEAFSLKDLASLPTLKDIQELAGSFGDTEQAELPLEGPAGEE